MKKTAIIFSLVFTLSLAVSAKKSETIKVQTVAASERRDKNDRTFRFVNSIIEGQHVRLSCTQWHNVYAKNSHCSDLGPATYDAIHKGDSVYILVPTPLSKKVQKEHWKIGGTW
ncbi:MAG: hypothetical protein ACYDCM_07135 [Candidatus Acidiferrales bacterium]